MYLSKRDRGRIGRYPRIGIDIMTYKIIRKNATKQINSLFSKATKITADVQNRNWLDDSFDGSNRSADLAEVREYMKANYNGLRLVLEFNEDGTEKLLRVDLKGWSSKSFVVSFMPNTDVIPSKEAKEQPVKPRMTLEAVQAYRAKGFASPLNHGGVESQCCDLDDVKRIESIKVKFSESNYFESNSVVTMEEYNRLEWLTLVQERQWGNVGYAKTYLELTLGNGDVIEFRHDICVKERGLVAQWSSWVDYCQTEVNKKAVH